jgi:hypothetical protein
MILAATACGKSPPKQAGNADSLAFVAAMEQGGGGKAVPAIVVPKDLTLVAIAAAQNNCSRGRVECKDYKIQPDGSGARELTAADRANGIEDRWCVTVSSLRRYAGQPWADLEYGKRYTKHSGAWQLEGDTGYLC